MLEFIVIILVNGLAVLLTAKLLPGIEVKDYWNAVLVAIVLAIINSTIRPVLVFLTLPITFVTLGLFIIVINALMLMLASALLSGFKVKNFWWAALMSLVLAVINAVLFSVIPGV